MRVPPFKPIFPSLCRIALWVTACFAAELTAGGPATGAGLADREHARLSAAVDEAQELLRKGDEAYQTGRYADAVEAYAGAVDMIPAAPVSAELHAAAITRYVQASIEQARVLAKKGDVAGAKAAVAKVLRAEVAPDNPAAVALRGAAGTDELATYCAGRLAGFKCPRRWLVVEVLPRSGAGKIRRAEVRQLLDPAGRRRQL